LLEILCPFYGPISIVCALSINLLRLGNMSGKLSARDVRNTHQADSLLVQFAVLFLTSRCSSPVENASAGRKPFITGIMQDIVEIAVLSLII
jgi:hypothetical protein